MAYLRLNRIYKVYPNGVKAVNDFSIDIEDKEFIVFVGPSGCGKSTTLRMIAGLEEITAGELFLEEKLINDIEPENRDIAMVFQNYALYPHMSVYDNMAFGLKNRKVKDHIIKEKINEAVKILDLEGYLHKKPREMSGGQAQRVALGRAIVRNPKVFLFDEPLSNLDAKLRASMRSEITKLHKKLQTTFIYVTHDQVEAMTMGTRIVVMKDGYVQQIDEPMNLYYNPVNKFVAGFIGTPQMNFFNITLARKANNVVMNFSDKADYQVSYEEVAKIDEKYLNGKTEVYLGVRPEHFIISKKKTGLAIVVNFFEQLGDEVIIYGDFEQDQDTFTISDDSHSIIVKGNADDKVAVGDVIHLALKEDKFHLFDMTTEATILATVPVHSTVSGTSEHKKLKVFNGAVSLPPAFNNKLPKAATIRLEIPPTAFIPGKDFSLPIEKVETVNDQNLVHLKYGDKFIFALTNQKVKGGDDFSFTLALEELHIYEDEISLLTPLKEEIIFHGKLLRERVKEGRRIIKKYALAFGGIKMPITAQEADKIIAIDGRSSFKRNYIFKISKPTISDLADGLISATVEETFDYGRVSFATLRVGSEIITTRLPDGFKPVSPVKLLFTNEDIEVWHESFDFRII